MLSPSLFFVIVTSIIGSFQVFTSAYVMTEGGPGHSTEVATYLIYEEAFRKFDFGYASTISVLLFVLILVVTISQFVYFERRTTYDFS